VIRTKERLPPEYLFVLKDVESLSLEAVDVVLKIQR
jgi:hypothetical protein